MKVHLIHKKSRIIVVMMTARIIMIIPITMIMIDGIRIVIWGLIIIIQLGGRTGDGIIATIRHIGAGGGHPLYILIMHTIPFIRIIGVGITIPLTDITQDHIGVTIQIVPT